MHVYARLALVCARSEGRYGGLFRDGPLPEGAYFPELGNAWTAPVIVWVGLHMLLFNGHDSTLLKAIAALIVANGIFSFSFHYTGFVSLRDADGTPHACRRGLGCVHLISSFDDRALGR